MADGSDARVPLTDGNCEPEPLTAGNDDGWEAPLDDGGAVADAGPGGPFTAGNGELLLGCAPPDTGGNGLCAHAAPIGAASAVSTTGTRSPRTIKIISLCR